MQEVLSEVARMASWDQGETRRQTDRNSLSLPLSLSLSISLTRCQVPVQQDRSAGEASIGVTADYGRLQNNALASHSVSRARRLLGAADKMGATGHLARCHASSASDVLSLVVSPIFSSLGRRRRRKGARTDWTITVRNTIRTLLLLGTQ